MAVSTALFAAATGASRVVGMLREAAAAWIFTVQGEAINAFTVAYQIPNLIRSLVADAALGAAFVPIFSELLTRGERERAWRVASTVWWLSFAALSAVTGIAMVLAPQLLALFGYHGALGVNLARIIFPTVVLLGLNGLQSAILNALDEFFLPAIAPVAWNIVIVGTLALGLPFLHTTATRIYAYAIGILLGTVVQLALPYPAMRRLGRLAWYCDPSDEAVQRVFALMLPVTLGLGLINLNVLVDTWFAANVNHDIGPAAVDKAFRIYMLPQGMFSVAVAAVLFPALARRAAARDGPGFRDLLEAGLRQIAFLLVPAAALCAALATPMVRLLYEHGNFTPHDTVVVAGCLAAFSGGLVFNGAMLLLNRAYMGMQMAWVPTSIAVATLLLNGVLDWIFTRSLGLGVWSIPLATSIVNVFGVAMLYLRLRPRAGRLDERDLVRALVRIAVASAFAVAAGWTAWRGLDAVLGQYVVYQLITLGAGLAAAVGIYVLAARALRIEELDDVRALIRRRPKIGV
ncbi:MAG: putative peptidoglycan lipid flippase [Gaiellales bacterium]|jgi:putative peptidoglycan lipid II flippase|nr:putative peptidoglycan lipid flippase [Gaiellales bacterium]